MKQAVHVQLPAKLGVLFGGGREQGCQVVYLLGLVLAHHFFQPVLIQHIQQLEGPGLLHVGVFGGAHVGGYHVGGAVALAQLVSQFQAKLAAGADNKNGVAGSGGGAGRVHRERGVGFEVGNRVAKIPARAVI